MHWYVFQLNFIDIFHIISTIYQMIIMHSITVYLDILFLIIKLITMKLHCLSVAYVYIIKCSIKQGKKIPFPMLF